MKLRVLVPRYRAQKWVFIPILILAEWDSIRGLMLSGVTAAVLARGPVLPVSSAYTRARRPSYSTSASSVGNASKRARWRALFFLNSLLAHLKPEIPLTSLGKRTKIIIIWLCPKLSNSMSLRGMKWRSNLIKGWDCRAPCDRSQRLLKSHYFWYRLNI